MFFCFFLCSLIDFVPPNRRIFSSQQSHSSPKAKSTLSKSLGSILRKLQKQRERSCSVPKCPGHLDVETVLLKPYPPIFALAICWAEPNPPLSEITTFLGILDEELDLSEAFLTAEEAGGGLRKSVTTKRMYRLRGIVSYYLKHYVASFYNDKKGVWFSFDDVSVQEIARDWKGVVAHSKRGHLKPVLVLYERVSGDQEDNTPSARSATTSHRSLLDMLRDSGGTMRVSGPNKVSAVPNKHPG